MTPCGITLSLDNRLVLHHKGLVVAKVRLLTNDVRIRIQIAIEFEY